MINEVVGEELLEGFEIPATLHLFGVPADNSFGGIG
jgi:hypothetical protein